MRSQRNPASQTGSVANTALILTLALSLLLLVALSPAPTTAAEPIVVRDRSGKVVERRYQKGNRKEIRSPARKLIRIEIKRGDRIEVRSPSGRLLQTKKSK